MPTLLSLFIEILSLSTPLLFLSIFLFSSLFSLFREILSLSYRIFLSLFLFAFASFTFISLMRSSLFSILISSFVLGGGFATFFTFFFFFLTSQGGTIWFIITLCFDSVSWLWLAIKSSLLFFSDIKSSLPKLIQSRLSSILSLLSLSSILSLLSLLSLSSFTFSIIEISFSSFFLLLSSSLLITLLSIITVCVVFWINSSIFGKLDSLGLIWSFLITDLSSLSYSSISIAFPFS